jgi:hypothetical protein
VRLALSLLIGAHFVAIVLAVTSYSSPGFPAPVLAVRAATIAQPYLQLTFLNSAYRFFAPNPGTPIVFWFRVQYTDGQVRWIELPGRSTPLWRAPYQRRLNLALQVGQHLSFVPQANGTQVLAPMGRLLLESAVRHLAHASARQDAAGRPLPVVNVGAYCVFHSVVTPAEVRDGWRPADLRSYRPVFVGAYTPGGERIDEFRPTVVEQSIAYVVAGIVDVDVRPAMTGNRTAGDAAGTVSLPEPVNAFLAQHPELIVAAPDESLERRVQAMLATPR